jgi:hypothetical protein
MKTILPALMAVALSAAPALAADFPREPLIYDTQPPNGGRASPACEKPWDVLVQRAHGGQWTGRLLLEQLRLLAPVGRRRRNAPQPYADRMVSLVPTKCRAIILLRNAARWRGFALQRLRDQCGLVLGARMGWDLSHTMMEI